MSAIVTGLVWELPQTDEFGRPEKMILLAYADHADANGKNIYPSVDLVGRKSFYEERSVQAITRKLEAQGYLVADGMGPHGTNKWHIPLERTSDGGAKIAPLQKKQVQNFAPEGIAPEGIAPEPSVVVVNRDDRLSATAQLLEGLVGGLKSTDADLIQTWLEKHTDEWIAKAFEIAKAKRARSANYVDTILIGWEANGYPKSRDEKVQGAKHADDKSRTPSRAKTNVKPALNPADLAAAERINARKQAARV
ncbi:MAG: DnaD domain protein [Chloroflexi bacterium]|nr:DnaD domain protein [Chloroflexota bacterium]